MHTAARPLPAPAAGKQLLGQPRCRAARTRGARFSCVAAAAAKGFGGKAAANPVGVQKKDECPCGSAHSFALCCGAHHGGQVEPTAEAVMRARFTAYVKGGEALKYIVDSTHPRSPDMKRVEGDDEAVARTQLLKDAAVTHDNLAFKKLTIVSSERGGTEQEQWVTFRATYSDRHKSTDDGPRSKGAARATQGKLWKDEKESTKVLAQRARFLKDETAGRWLYFGGTLLTPNGLGTYSPPPPPGAEQA